MGVMMNVKFYELAVGAEFTAFGRAYQKVAMSMAEVLAHGHQLPDGHQVADPHREEGRSGVEGRTSRVEGLPVENRRYGRMESCATPEVADGPKPGSGWVFMGLTEVVSDGPMLPTEVAERWRPARVEAWAEHLVPAPGQR